MRLQLLWEEVHPDIPTQVSALKQRLSRLRKAKNMAQPLVDEDSSQSSGAMPSAEEHDPTLPSVFGKGPGVNITGQPASQAKGDKPLSLGPIPSTPAQGQPALDRIDEDDHSDDESNTPSDELHEEYQAMVR